MLAIIKLCIRKIFLITLPYCKKTLQPLSLSFQVQRYEGASTLYGPHTLEAYERHFQMLADNLQLRERIDHDLQPVDLLSQQVSFKLNVMFDGTRRGRSFGDVLQDVRPEYIVVGLHSFLALSSEWEKCNDFGLCLCFIFPTFSSFLDYVEKDSEI